LPVDLRGGPRGPHQGLLGSVWGSAAVSGLGVRAGRGDGGPRVSAEARRAGRRSGRRGHAVVLYLSGRPGLAAPVGPAFCSIMAMVPGPPPQERPMLPDQSNQSEPFPREQIPPEILEWARQTFDEEEFLAQVREIEATGGLRLEDFIAEV